MYTLVTMFVFRIHSSHGYKTFHDNILGFGSTGFTGIQGIQGPTGPAGLQGSTGPQGPPGTAGSSGGKCQLIADRFIDRVVHYQKQSRIDNPSAVFTGS